MFFSSKVILGCVCLPLVLSGAMAAQSAGAGRPSQPGTSAGPAVVATGGTQVHGTITDPQGELIPGATITLTPSKGPARKATSGGDGTYTLTVTPGIYTMTVTMKGFASYSVANLKVPAVPSTTVDAKLSVGEATQVVNVEASTVQLSVDQDSNASSTVISGKDLEALSDDPDELSSELTALAGPSAGPNGGQIYVDGFTGGQLPPKSSIREIRINQNPFSAQYDRLGYGRVEVFTKPGTDKYHGSFQINGNPSQFNSANPLVTTYQPPYHTLFLFGNLSGPLGKNRSFSLGGSHRDIEDDAFTSATILSQTAGSTTACAPGNPACTFQNAVQASTYYPQLRTEISPRFDFAFGEKNVLTARFQYVQNDATNAGVGILVLPSAGSNTDAKDEEVQISDTQTFSSQLINETRFEYERERNSTTALSNAPSIQVEGAFTGGGSTGQNQTDHQDHFEVQNYTSLQLKKNFIRLGGRLRTTRDAQNSEVNTNGTFIYSSLTPQSSATGRQGSYQAGTPSQFIYNQISVPNVSFTLADLGLYAETDWKARKNLTISYGLRYETQNHLNDHHDIAPRVSFAYGLGSSKGAPKTVIRGGFGLFYDRFAQAQVLTLARQGQRTNVETVYTLDNVPSSCTPDPTSPLSAPLSTATIQSCLSGASATQAAKYSTAPNLRTPYIVQIAAGADQQVSRFGTISVNYLHAQGVHQLATQNVGYPTYPNPVYLPGQSSPISYQYFSEGVFDQNQLIINGRVQTGRRVSLFGYYSLNSAHGDTSGAASFITTPYNIAADYGRTTFDVRSRIFVAGSITLPSFIQFSPYIQAQSGSPYNITSGTDLNGDTIFNDRPYLANGTPVNGTTVKSIAGCGTFAQPGSQVPGSVATPINYCTGPGLFTFNFRLTKTFGFGQLLARQDNGQGGGQGGPGGPGGPEGSSSHGSHGGGHSGSHSGSSGGFGGGGASTGKRYNMAIGLQVQNLFNNEDLATPIGTLSSPLFGQSNAVEGSPYTTQSALRRISLQVSFNF